MCCFYIYIPREQYQKLSPERLKLNVHIRVSNLEVGLEVVVGRCRGTGWSVSGSLSEPRPASEGVL